jgi:hypothetical protein
MMKIEIYDHATGEQITRDMTADELTANEAMLAENEARKQNEADRAALKKATLAKLGLTADEVAALLF